MEIFGSTIVNDHNWSQNWLFFYSTSAIVLQKQCHYKAVILTLFSKYNKFKEAIISIADSENKSRATNLAQPWVI